MSFRCPLVAGRLALACCVFLLLAPGLRAADDLGLQVPAGFEVSLYADDALAHDIYSMTLDSQGRVVVSGAGYVKILHDTDQDGRADRATQFSSVPASGAHGMDFDGADLICTGDNRVMRLADANQDGVADGPPQIWTELRNPEHGANGLVRGPDGCFYLIGGNDAGISDKQISVSNSPVRQPRAGGVVRFSADGKPLDVYAHGFRNPYDLDFDAQGHLLTVDSDGERDYHLPWYAPTRLFDIAQGMEHGWLLSGWVRSWNRPQSFFDSVDRMVEIGRGSPTGVAAYRHRAFPAKYQGGLFAACWTLGRVYYFPLAPQGATCRGSMEVFLQTTGDIGFAPCDLAIGPTGDLFVAIGGRRTRGSVFRVRYVGNPSPKANEAATPLEQVLTADQPLASWSRARWVPIARQLGKAPFEQAAANEKLPSPQRVRAIEVLVELFGGVDPQLAEKWRTTPQAEVRARLAWALGRAESSPAAVSQLIQLTTDEDPSVERAAWEALATLPGTIDTALPTAPNWRSGLNSDERRVRAAAIAVARTTGQDSYRRFAARLTREARLPNERLAQLWINQPPRGASDWQSVFGPAEIAVCLQAFADSKGKPIAQLEAVRLLQIGLGDMQLEKGDAEVYAGYGCPALHRVDAASRARIVSELAPQFPTKDDELNRELARLLGMLRAEHTGLLSAMATPFQLITTPIEDDIHYLIVASRLTGPRDSRHTVATARVLLGLHNKLDDAGIPSRNWPDRIGELFDQLVRQDPNLPAAILTNADLVHVEHTLFIERLPEGLRGEATRKLWKQWVGRGGEPNSELIALVGRLPAEEAIPLLRSQWEQGGLRDAIVLALAKNPQDADRAKFIEALGSAQPQVVERAAKALTHLGLDCTSDEMAAALRALKLACATPKQLEPRKSIVRLLDFWTETNSDVEEEPDPSQIYVPWFEMFEFYYPAAAAKLKASSGADAATWRKRLAAVDWTTGTPERGQKLFELRACHRCHQANGHLGPELKGAVARMSREDLFTAILDPNLEVSPTYATTAIVTQEGQVYHGLVVYESPESTLLQTGPDTTVRITGVEAGSQRKSLQSLMPNGLLDTFSDQDLSDLYAYLKTLANK